MLLTSTSDIIRVVTSSTADIHVQAGWADITTSAFTPGRTNTVITTATTTTIVAGPGASTQRQVKSLSIYNAHGSTSNTVTIQHFDGTTSVTVYKVTLAAGSRAQYNGDEWPSTATSIGITDGDKGDITVSSDGTVWTIDTPTSTTIATDDKVLIKDTSAADATKYVTAQSIADLPSATKTATQNVVIGGNSTAAGYIDLLEDSDNGSNKITITAPSSIASDKTVTLQDVTGTVYVSGGTDIAIADGGTGVSSVVGCLAQPSASSQTIAYDTATKVILDGESYDTGNIFDNVTNYRVTIPTSGYYDVRAKTLFGSVPAGRFCVLMIYKNGSELDRDTTLCFDTGADIKCAISKIYNFAATDYVELFVFHTNAGSSSLDIFSSNTYFTVNQIIIGS